MRRYQFRAVHIIALDYASHTATGWNIQLPELGTPTNEVKLRDIEKLHWSTLEAARVQAWPGGNVPTFNPFLYGERAHVLSKEIIERSLVIAHEIASRPGHDREMLTRLYEAYSLAANASYAHSFTICWTVTEQCLTIMHNRMIGEVGRPRRRPARIHDVINDLNALRIFEPEDYSLLQRARSTRNRLVHDIDTVDLQTALDLMWATKKLLGAAISFAPTFGFTGHSPG